MVNSHSEPFIYNLRLSREVRKKQELKPTTLENIPYYVLIK
jgi:hypothetical protein